MYEKNNNGYFNPVNHTTETDEKERIRLCKNNLQRTVWASFFGVVSALSITLSVYFGMMYKDTRQAQLTSEDYYKQQSINACRRSMFNISDGLQNTDANIGKLLVSSDKTFIVKTLTETEGIAQSSVADLSYLPIDAGVSVSTAKYFNQLGDYCNSLSKSVADKGFLSQDQKDSLEELRKVGNKLQKSMHNATKNQDSFVWGLNEGNYTFHIELEDVDEATFDYPQLVYDGPFSDSVTHKTFDRQMKSVKEVEDLLYKTFKDYGVDDLQFKAKADNKASVYYFTLTLDGVEYSVTTATDGTVAELNKNGTDFIDNETQTAMAQNKNDIDGKDKNDLEMRCCEVAQKMADTLGYDVLPMWTSEPIDGRVYVNMISRQNDINLYPDMVKMAIDAQTCQVVGLDAFGYIANHTERQLPTEYMTVQQAKDCIAKDLEAQRAELCIVPDGNQEKLCYEIKVKKDTESFLIYIDAVSGEEVDILKIIEDKMGYTVM